MITPGRRSGLLHVFLVALSCLWSAPAMAAPLTFTLTTSEAAKVTGTPRIAIDVGGVTRYATYAAGTGTAALTFSYAVQQGDFDPDGITVASPLDLNGGAITDLAGNPLSSLAFTIPATASVKVQTYTAAFSAVTNSNANAASFTISKAPTGAPFTYTITTSGGTNSLSGSGTISGLTHTVSGIDLSSFPPGTLTVSVTVATAAGVQGAARTATVTPSFTGVLDSVGPAAAAFSTRLLRGAYAGPLLRVRRSSDNAEQDIGASLGGNLDTAALAGFCGATSCFVRSWYDQSGNGRNATQATSAAQPRIVNAGAVDTVNGRPAIKGDGTNDQMVFPLGPLVAFPATINVVVAKTSTSERGSWVKIGGGTDAGIALGVGATAFVDFGEKIIGLKELVNWMPTSVLASSAVITYTQAASASSSFIFQNGVALSVPNAASAPIAPTVTTGYLFGQSYLYAGVTQQRWAVNPMAEVILLAAIASTSQRQTLERDQGAWYGITVQ